MAWSNKAVGIGASAVVGGVLATLFGVILGWLGEDDDENLDFSNANDPVRISDISIRYGYAGPYGPGLLVSMEVQHKKVFRGECAVFVRPRLGKFGIKAKLKDYAAPEDGCILAEGTLEAKAGAKTASTSVYLPYAAFREDWDHSFTLDVFVVDAAPVEVIAARSVHCQWIPAPLQADLNLMAVLADAAVAMVRRATPLARKDVRCIREQLTLIFELDKEGLELLRQYLKRADAAPRPVSDIATRLSHVIEDESEYPDVLRFLYNVAAVSGTVHPEKEAFVLDLVRLMGINEQIHTSVRAEFQADIAQHFATLELPVTADFNEVRRAYRRLASDYHPDRVQTLPRGFQDYATQKFREIQTAYEALRKHFGNSHI